jgi:hypothetical protein
MATLRRDRSISTEVPEPLPWSRHEPDPVRRRNGRTTWLGDSFPLPLIPNLRSGRWSWVDFERSDTPQSSPPQARHRNHMSGSTNSVRRTP